MKVIAKFHLYKGSNWSPLHILLVEQLVPQQQFIHHFQKFVLDVKLN